MGKGKENVMGCEVLVDGYNVIKNNLMFRSLQTRSLAEARNVLIRQLKNRYRHAFQRVTVVFDGDGAYEQVSHDEHIRIIFSRHGETADSVIIRLASEARMAGREVEMYSDDGEIQQSVATKGGTVCTTGQLVTRLNAAPRDVASRSMHRQAMRRLYGIDPSYKPDDEREPPRPHGKKKRKSSRHRK
jgi:predicted RNA-binding protein with PIN domain